MSPLPPCPRMCVKLIFPLTLGQGGRGGAGGHSKAKCLHAFWKHVFLGTCVFCDGIDVFWCFLKNVFRVMQINCPGVLVKMCFLIVFLKFVKTAPWLQENTFFGGLKIHPAATNHEKPKVPSTILDTVFSITV